MLIDKIRIRNYRSCKDVTIYPEDMMALVGPNNAGKTNILSALNFLLGERWPSRQGLALSDFFNQDERRPLAIEVKFRPNDDKIATMQFAEDPANGDLRARYTYFNNPKLYTLNNEAREKGAIVYLDAARSFDAHFSPSRWSMFGRIARELHDDFLKNSPEEVKQALTGHLHDAQEILKTERYRSFETAIKTAFDDQVRRHTHGVALQFRTFDPLNFYKSLQPLLLENGKEKSPSEAGSGMRNLVVLALFRAYAKAFRGDAIFAIEEPEIFLHPHAQRSLATLFEELAKVGNQIFFSTHSATFVNIARSERVVLVQQCDDEEDENCTQVRQMDPNELLRSREELHPTVDMTLSSVQEKLRLLCGLEHAEAFFARAVLLVEAPTERDAMPIYARGMGVDFDALGISVVSASGKTNLDALWHLYTAHGIPCFLMFDNDRGGDVKDKDWNSVLTRMLDLDENEMPDADIGDNYAILEGNFEKTVMNESDHEGAFSYKALDADAILDVGPSKPLRARYIAEALVGCGTVPVTMAEVARRMEQLVKRQVNSEDD